MFSVLTQMFFTAALQASTASAPVIPCETPPAGTACIPGGDFFRGSDDGPLNTRPRETVWTQTFYMDVFETTVKQYEDCVTSGHCKKAHTAYNDYSRPKQPKVGLSWFHAVTFCKAMGKHLPTEAQWEKAARGTDGRIYPWGNEVATCKLAVIMDERGRSCGVPKQGSHPDKGRTFEVGTLAPNQYGLYDMAGNSWEWVYDWYSPSYQECGSVCGGIEPRGPCDGKAPCDGHDQRIVRGGSWYWPASHATTFYRRAHFPANNPYHHFGLRCAASVEEARALRGAETPPVP